MAMLCFLQNVFNKERLEKKQQKIDETNYSTCSCKMLNRTKLFLQFTYKDSIHLYLYGNEKTDVQMKKYVVRDKIVIQVFFGNTLQCEKTFLLFVVGNAMKTQSKCLYQH